MGKETSIKAFVEFQGQVHPENSENFLRKEKLSQNFSIRIRKVKSGLRLSSTSHPSKLSKPTLKNRGNRNNG